MELAIDSSYERGYKDDRDTLKELADARKAGFTHIHWCHEWGSDYLYSASEIQHIKEMYEEADVKAKSLHASCGSFRKQFYEMSECSRISGVELVKNRVDLAHAIGATEIVLHMYLPYEKIEKDPSYFDTFLSQAERSLDELEPYCRERNVRICLENLFEAPGEMQIAQFDRLLKRYSPEYLGLCIDTGHANLVWGHEFVEKLVKPFKDRIYSVHLHDNPGWGAPPDYGDTHNVPGTNPFPWKEFMAVLKESAYEYPLVLELSMPRGEERMHFLKRAYEAGQWLYSL